MQFSIKSINWALVVAIAVAVAAVMVAVNHMSVQAADGSTKLKMLNKE